MKIKNGKVRVHWSQTAAGRKRISDGMRRYHKARIASKVIENGVRTTEHTHPVLGKYTFVQPNGLQSHTDTLAAKLNQWFIDLTFSDKLELIQQFITGEGAHAK